MNQQESDVFLLLLRNNEENHFLVGINISSTIDIVDALLIALYYVGLITSFPGQSSGEVQVVKSAPSRDPSPQPVAGELEAPVAGNNQFAIDCCHQLQGKDGNSFFSWAG